jgi:fluoroquinolone transport system permease protein
MKAKALLVGDITLQYKYGFYFLYVFLTLFYIALLSVLPFGWRSTAAILMIFSDPAALGIFFMGALVLYEKGERVLDSLAVSPVQPREYVLSKMISLSIIATTTASAIALYAKLQSKPIYFFLGLFLGSNLFSAAGLIVAVRIKTLNEFILRTIPFLAAINLPAIFYVFRDDAAWMLIHPGVSMICLLRSGPLSPIALCILSVWTIAVYLLACHLVKKAFYALGGCKT